MAKKRRKRTNSNVPAKGRLRDMADELWKLAVWDDWAYKCAVCHRGNVKLDAHHIIPRHHDRFRYDVKNGILLCFQHHNHDNDVAPHQNAAGWLQWLGEFHQALHKWYVETTETGAHRVFVLTKNPAYYCDQIQRLREYVDDDEFRRVCGVKFSGWLENNQ